MRRTLFIGAFVCLFAQYAQAIDVTAATCGQAQIQAALVGRVAGDKVRIPAGTCRWTTQGTWNIPTGVSVIGAGIDQTIIIDNYKPGGTQQYYTAGPLLSIYPGADLSRMSGFTIVADSANSNYKYAIVTVYGTSKNFRADHIRFNLENGVFPEFNNAVPSGFEYFGYITGVMDHFQLNLSDRGAAFIVHYDGYGGVAEGDGSWAAPTGLGTSDFLFFEDSVITNWGSGGVVNDCYHGGKFVVRKNQIQGAGFAQTHPTGGSFRARGCRAWEAYENTITKGGNGTSNFNGFFLSSGTGVVWGNTAQDQALSNFITMHSMRVPGSSGYGQVAPPAGWGYYPSVYDAPDGRALDQPGSGRSDLLQNPFPTVRNTATNCAAPSACVNPRQLSEPIYEWNNTWSCFQCGGIKISIYEAGQIRIGRDIFPDTPKPNYVKFTYPHPLNVPDGGTVPVTPAVPGRLRLDAF